MRFAIDASTICDASGREGAGIEHYTWSLVFSLARAFPSHRFLVLVPVAFQKASERELIGSCVNLRIIRSWSWRVPFVFRHLLFPLAAFLWRAEVLLLPATHGPVGWRGKTVSVVHDVAIYEHPEWFPISSVENFTTKWIVPRALSHTTSIAAVSEETKKALVRVFPFLRQQVFVVGQGVEFQEFQGTISGVEEFVLFLGTMEPRKNIETACRSFDLFLQAHQEKAKGLKLIIAGMEGWKTESIHEAIMEVNRRWEETAGEDVVRVVGHVSEREKWFLLHHAQAFLFPSLDEGFGRPVLEAMAAGAPVVCSNAGALPEIVGDAALLANPRDAETFALLLSQCLLMPEVAEALRAAGKERAKLFSWNKVAKQIGNILESAANG